MHPNMCSIQSKISAAVAREHPQNAEALANYKSAMDNSRILAALQSQANSQVAIQEDNSGM